MEAADDYWRPFFLVLGLYGLRMGEAAALTTGDVDLVAGRLYVRRTLTRDGRLVEPKTPHAVRSFELSGFMCRVLDEHMARIPETPEGLLFPMPSGRPIDPSNFYRRVMAPLREKLGLDRLCPHMFRKMYATQLVTVGADDRYVLMHIGHADLATTHKHYIRLRDAGGNEVQERLESPAARSSA